ITCPPESVKIVSTPCAAIARAASLPPCIRSAMPPSVTPLTRGLFYPLARVRQPAAPEHAEERVDDVGRELRPASAPNLLGRLVPAERALVGPIGRHRVPRVGEPDDVRLERHRLAGEPVGIAAAVPALVVMVDERHARAQPAELADDRGAVGRVALDRLELRGIQTRGL